MPDDPGPKAPHALSKTEADDHLTKVWSWRGSLYEMYASSLMVDYAPDFARFHFWGADLFGRPSHVNAVLMSAANIHSYMMLGWETGIENEFATLLRNGLAVERTMEMVMFSQLYAGMRGLGHVFRAVGSLLPSFGPPELPLAPFPDGWDVDPDAFRCGLDLSTRAMTDADRSNLVKWYEETIGFVPTSVQFGLQHHPQFVKVNRAKWEVAIKTIPKQIVPYLLLRHHTITGSHEGLREAALLGRAWGMTDEWIVQSVACAAAYFTSADGLYSAHAALDDILD